MARTFALILCAGLAVGACARQGDFPSLAPRAVEQPRADIVAPPPGATTDPAIQSRLSASLAKAKGTESDFDKALATARTATAQAGAYGSDSWIAAQMAIARLERTREPVQVALTELTDQQRLVLLAQSGDDQAAVAATMSAVSALDRAQGDAVQALLARLSRR